MDKATPTLRQRCDTALQSLPDAPYRAMLAALFDEMLAEVERLAAQAEPQPDEADLRQLMGMGEAEIDAELIAAGISPDDAVKRADRAIKEALATIRAERRASSGATTPAAPFAKDSWQHAVDNQLVAFGRTSQEFANPHEALAWLAIMNMELGQSNAGATTQAVRMLTKEELTDLIASTVAALTKGQP